MREAPERSVLILSFGRPSWLRISSVYIFPNGVGGGREGITFLKSYLFKAHFVPFLEGHFFNKVKSDLHSNKKCFNLTIYLNFYFFCENAP